MVARNLNGLAVKKISCQVIISICLNQTTLSANNTPKLPRTVLPEEPRGSEGSAAEGNIGAEDAIAEVLQFAAAQRFV